MFGKKLIWAAVVAIALGGAGAASAEENPIDALFNGLGQIFSGDGGTALYPEQVSRYLAISKRKRVPVEIADKLIERGNNAVAGALVNNEGAEISEQGYDRIVDVHTLQAAKQRFDLFRLPRPETALPLLEFSEQFRRAHRRPLQPGVPMRRRSHGRWSTRPSAPRPDSYRTR